MATQFRLAALGHTMETGRVVEWHVSEGKPVEEGQLLVSIETDKTVVEVNSPIGGTVLRIEGAVDEEYQVGDTLAWIGEDNEDIPDQIDVATTPTPDTSSSPRVTPVAERLAERHGIDPSALTGTGPDGRVTKDDVRRAIDNGNTDEVSAEHTTSIGVEINPLVGIRRRTAERLSSNWSVTPHVTEGIKVDGTAMVTLRENNKNAWLESKAAVPSINDFVLKATANALKNHPRLNAALIDNAIHQFQDIHLGVAVEVDAGLVVPVVHSSDSLSLLEIAAAVKQLGARAQSGQLTPEELAGATFTVTNLGNLGIDWFTPVLNPPQCAILGVGRVRKAPAVKDDAIVVRDTMTLVLTFDHRVIDGAPCARFLADLRNQIENPESLLS
jgi:pyruvate dehydrogenase E2 component (dihydrolipoamide acetyltransferase)